MLALRKFSPKLRLAIVEQAIGTIPDLGLVIIDGIRDFLYDINSSSESTDIISKFMQWTDDRQIHIHTVLHQNKNDDNGNISNYDDYIERLKEGYGLQGIKLGYNKAVKVATLLSDKQMVIKEGKDYAFNPEYHY